MAMSRFAAGFTSTAVAAGVLGAWLVLPRTTSVAAEPVLPTRTANMWIAEGTLLEACTCAVPCTCNFGQGPSPHNYCHAVYAYKLDKGAWNGVNVSGLIFGGADGPRGNIGFVDERATPAQSAVLEKLARVVFAKGGPAVGARTFLPARIRHQVDDHNLRLDIAGHGGFAARVIVGYDGKTPVVVENNTVWPIRRAIKAATHPLRYRDAHAGELRGENTNANYGAFAFTGPIREAVVAAPTPRRVAKRSSACCAPGG